MYWSNPEKVLKAVPQTFGAFTSPVETFEMAAKKKPAGIVLADNPITFWMFGNAYLEEDRMENKEKSELQNRRGHCQPDVHVAF